MHASPDSGFSGDDYLMKGDLESAAACFMQQFEEAQDSQLKCLAAERAADVLIQMGELGRAAVYLETVRETGQGYQIEMALSRLFSIYITINRTDRAEQIVKEGLEKSPVFHREAALLDKKNGNLPGAVSHLETFYRFSRDRETLPMLLALYQSLSVTSEKTAFWRISSDQYPELYLRLLGETNAAEIPLFLAALSVSRKLNQTHVEQALSVLWEKNMIETAGIVLRDSAETLPAGHLLPLRFRHSVMSEDEPGMNAIIDQLLELMNTNHRKAEEAERVRNLAASGKYSEVIQSVVQDTEELFTSQQKSLAALTSSVEISARRIAQDISQSVVQLQSSTNDAMNSLKNCLLFLKTMGHYDQALSIITRCEPVTGELREMDEILAMKGENKAFLARLFRRDPSTWANHLTAYRQFFSPVQWSGLIETLFNGDFFRDIPLEEQALTFLATGKTGSAEVVLASIPLISKRLASEIDSINTTEGMNLIASVWNKSEQPFRNTWLNRLAVHAEESGELDAAATFLREILTTTDDLTIRSRLCWLKLREFGLEGCDTAEVSSFFPKALDFLNGRDSDENLLLGDTAGLSGKELQIELGRRFQHNPDSAKEETLRFLLGGTSDTALRTMYLALVLREALVDDKSADREFLLSLSLLLLGLDRDMSRLFGDSQKKDMLLLRNLFPSKQFTCEVETLYQNWSGTLPSFMAERIILRMPKQAEATKNYLLNQGSQDYFSGKILSAD
ncbi:MAG: hypothetical protein PHQ23_04150 [Candidatus Wallbacteria bacterium]|nr:hypothetical protein [Candidatus Wallbacteria bacterium]